MEKNEGLNMKFNVILSEAEEGGYNSIVPALDGCFSEGNSIEEALENTKEAIFCYLEGLEKVNNYRTQNHDIIRELEVII